MTRSIAEIIDSYNPNAPLDDAYSPPAEWYTDARILDFERRNVFAKSWQMIGRASQVREPGQYATADLAGEPILIVRGHDGILRGFFNLCRHKGSAILTEPEGIVQQLRCPYHAWTYTLEGTLKGVPDFTSVRNFDPAKNGLVPVRTALWENWIFANLEPQGASLASFLDSGLTARIQRLGLENFHWMERRRYTLNCNWKVFVDNYLDGGYHVPHLHKGLDSVLDYGAYTIETESRFCLQTSPLSRASAKGEIGALRAGERAFYLWIYPNFMLNCYEGIMDSNLVLPLAPDRTEVIFDYYFTDLSETARKRNAASIALSERIQEEDVAICNSVQRGLSSRAYKPGRLSVRREAGEHLFHRLLYADLKSGLPESDFRNP